MAPLLRWAGSKRKLIPFILRAIPSEFGRYIEPFAGSACVYLKIAPERAILSDTNEELIATYRTVRSAPDKVFEALSDFPRSKDLYYLLRASSPSDFDKFTRAARFIYLNKFCFNGVYRTNKHGEFNVPMGIKGGRIPDLFELRAISSRLKNAALVCSDFQVIVENATLGDFIYMDPPYLDMNTRYRGEYGYRSGAFSTSDETRLLESAQKATEAGAYVLLSYRKSLAKHLQGWQVRMAYVRRSVAGFNSARRRVTEVLMSNYHWAR